MFNVDFFHHKNPKAPDEYCAFASLLYVVLLRRDAFEHGVQIENYPSSFNFLFPNGRILIAGKILPGDIESVPCYVCHINETSQDFVCFGLSQLSRWLKNNWNNLMEDDKND